MAPLAVISIGFAGGIFLRSLVSFGWPPIVFTLLLGGICAIGGIIYERKGYALLALVFFFIALGMARMGQTDAPLPESFTSQVRHRVSFDAVVIGDPDLRDSTMRIPVRVEYAGESTNMLVVTHRSESVAVGDEVHISGILLRPEPFATDTGRMFRYDKYLARDGIYFLVEYGSIYTTATAPWYSIPALLSRVKHTFLNGLNAVLPEPFSSLAGGIVIGGKSGLGPDLQDAFQKSGLMQIIVLSGYNIMVVAEWVMLLLSRTPLTRTMKSVAGAFAVLLFVGIAGASTTAVRAMLMACIALYARATSRTYAASRALLLVVFLMLVWNPLYLVFDPGFELSVAATAGLIWLAPLFEHTLSFIKREALRNSIATTIAAQIAVLPLLLYLTGNLSLVALPANLLALPIVPVAMGVSVVAGSAGVLLNSVAPLLAIAIGYPAYLATSYLITLAQMAANLRFAAIMIAGFPLWLVAASYAALVFIASSKRFSTTPQLTLAKNAST